MQKLIRIGIGFFIFGTGAIYAQEIKSAESTQVVESAKTIPVGDQNVKSAEMKTAPVKNAAAGSTEKTEHNFEDLLVQGKYHFSDEAVTTVEEDKVLDSLLGVRTDFKDKIEQSVGRY